MVFSYSLMEGGTRSLMLCFVLKRARQTPPYVFIELNDLFPKTNFPWIPRESKIYRTTVQQKSRQAEFA
jgi:hypothetical protein